MQYAPNKILKDQKIYFKIGKRYFGLLIQKECLCADTQNTIEELFGQFALMNLWIISVQLEIIQNVLNSVIFTCGRVSHIYHAKNPKIRKSLCSPIQLIEETDVVITLLSVIMESIVTSQYVRKEILKL